MRAAMRAVMNFVCLNLASLVLLSVAGCVSFLPALDVDEVEFGKSFEGRAISGAIVTGESLSWRDEDPGGAVGRGAGGRETILVFAAIHGNESLTEPLARRLVEELDARPELARGKRVVVIYAANPDGFRNRTRGNARGVDLNRNFPASNWKERGERHGEEAASEPETRVLMEVVERFRPARILSIHAPLHCVDWDGPAQGLARAMGKECGYPVKKVGYPTPGSFGSWAGVDRGIPVITFELRRDLKASALWTEAGPAVLAFVADD